MNFLSDYYLYLKSFHLIFVIAWMAGLLYLPRLFVYHFDAKPGGELSQTLKTMESKLTNIIIIPAMILTFVFGFCLLITPGIINWSSGWIHAKLALLVLLFGFTGVLSKWRKRFAKDERFYSQMHFRIANEIPAVIMILIVILVVVKPF